MSERPSNIHTNNGGTVNIPDAAIRAINPMLDVASAETMLTAAYPHIRRAVIGELVAKLDRAAEETERDMDDNELSGVAGILLRRQEWALHWLRAELEGDDRG